eukprot:7058363-Pyramimonas_sp.AAC.1
MAPAPPPRMRAPRPALWGRAPKSPGRVLARHEPSAGDLPRGCSSDLAQVYLDDALGPGQPDHRSGTTW